MLPAMLRFLRTLVLTVPACFAACGARSPLGGPGGESGGTLLPDGGALPAAACPAWVATQARVQVSDIASIVELMSAIPTSTGVLVGYADSQLPAVDSSWHARLVSFGDGTLGAEETPFRRDSSQLGWTRISIAQGGGRGAATASDQATGMQFVPVDSNGAPSGPVARVAGDPARYMLPTSTGFSVLRSAFNDSGLLSPPVDLATLDPTGRVLSTRTLLDASTPVDWYTRVGLADGSFLLVWWGSNACAGCRAVHAEHFGEGGDSLAPAATVHTFDAHSYGGYAVAASSPPSTGFLFAWSDGAGPVDLFGEPFDANGRSAGAAHRFAELPGPNAPTFTLAGAPGGDFVAAWVDGLETSQGQVYVQSVAADGSAEGPPTTLAPISATPELNLLAVASPLGAMVLYESDIPNYGIEVYAVPLRCSQ
jgi:hypothetical protein